MKKQSFGTMIAALRKERGMTQLELAEQMGVTDKAVSKWERDLSFPDVSSLPRLAEIFGLEVRETPRAWYAGEGFEAMKQQGPGAMGHIGVGTLDLERAVAYFEARGIHFRPESLRRDDRGRLTGLREEVDQLWAEAVVRYKAGESLWMDTDELWYLATEAQDEHTVQDDLVGLIVDYLDKPLPDNWEDLSPEDRRDYIQGRSVIDAKVCTVRRDWVSVPEIRVELLEEKRSDIGRNGDLQSRRISDVLNHLPGWGRGKSKRVAGYGKQKVFIRLGDDCLK